MWWSVAGLITPLLKFPSVLSTARASRARSNLGGLGCRILTVNMGVGIWNYLGDTPLGGSMRILLDRINGGRRLTLRVNTFQWAVRILSSHHS